MGKALLGQGEFALVRQHLEAAIGASASWVGDHDVYATLVDAAALANDTAGIRQYAPRAEELAVRHGHVLYQAIAHRAWGIAHRLEGAHTEAQRHLHQALALFSRFDARWQMGRTSFELGKLAAAQGDTDKARDWFGRALVSFEALRANPDVLRTQAMLESLR
jgi:tetratricopeptide (TPR) repeat protein